jgi:pyruvate formate lyase activating enzyme
MRVKILPRKCSNCGQCSLVICPGGDVQRTLQKGNCMGCGACLLACPEEALQLVEEPINISKQDSARKRKVYVNKIDVKVSGLIKDALNAAGIETCKFPPEKENKGVFMPCDTGGCWACAVLVDGNYALSCLTPLYENMQIQVLENPPPLRVVSGFGAHTVGGVGTPHQLKKLREPVEVVCFTHGCNLHCPQCQNYQMAFTAAGHLMESDETAQILMGLKGQYQVNRVALSGGESTLNREWLLEVIQAIRDRDKDVHIHIDTNGTILTTDYIDSLVRAGMTEVGVDLKALRTSTFMGITDLSDEKLAKKYLKTAWKSVKYITDHYSGVFLGLGIPYKLALISREEVEEMGYRISSINENVQVCLLDYRGEFRRKSLALPSFQEMMEIKDILNRTGLKTVIAQTPEGHIGP